MQKRVSMKNDPIYQELKENYSNFSTEAIEAIMHFNKLSSLMEKRKEVLFAEHGLTATRFTILMHLKSSFPNYSLSPSELAKRMNVTRGTMTQFLDALVKDGLIKRIDCERDRRGIKIVLTNLAIEKIKILFPFHTSAMEGYFNVLDAFEKKNFREILEKMLETISPAEEINNNHIIGIA